MKNVYAAVMSAFLVGAGVLLGTLVQPEARLAAQSSTRVFEIRTYTVADNKAALLSELFRDHIVDIFAAHDMTNVGYWIPQDEPRSKDTLIYILAHKDRETAKQNWAAFFADPAFAKVREEEERLGVKVTKVESVFATPTEYSMLK